MSRSRRLLLIGIAAFLALGVSAGWLRYSLGGERSAMEAQRRDLDARIEQLTLGDTPTGNALERVTAARTQQRVKLDVLENLLVRPDQQYLPEGKDDPANHFKQLLVALREEARKTAGLTFQDVAPLGFASDVQKEKEVRLGLLRLAVAGRLLEALKSAAQTGPVHVVRIEHLPPREAVRLENLYQGPVALPLKISFAAGEREAAGFLQAVSSSAAGAQLQSISLEATASYEGITTEALLAHIFLGVSDVLPEKEEGGLPASRRRW